MAAVLSPRFDDFPRHRPSPLQLQYAVNPLGSASLISPVAACTPLYSPAAGGRAPRTPSSPFAAAAVVRPSMMAAQGRASFGTPTPLTLGARRRSSHSPERLQQQQQQQQLRSSTPTSATARRFSLPSSTEQDSFEALCRARFYQSDASATAAIEATLSDASPTAQSCYNRILSLVRSQYHEDVARRRREEYEQLFRDVRPDVFLTREERKDRLTAFLESYASKQMVGTHPFAKALYTLLNLQATKAGSRGGAGGQCLEWTIEDQVFMEAGPASWPKDSVGLLVTTLGFSDVSPPLQTDAANGSSGNAGAEPRSPFADPDLPSSTPAGVLPIGHARRPSDPFSDKAALSGSCPDVVATAQLGAAPKHAGSSTVGVGATQPAMMQEGRKRTFRMSDMTNPEIRELLAVFPPWIANSQVHALRFAPTATSYTKVDRGDASTSRLLEEGALRDENWDTEDHHRLKVATGFLTISQEERLPGYEGSLVERVKGWIKRILHLR